MVESARTLWPCIGEAGLEVFTTTADQRYLLGEDIFLQTHFPVTLRQFYPDGPSRALDEATLLEWLLRTEHAGPGNRVLVLYGAAGSGKSELIKWLQVLMTHHTPARAEVTVRIPRTGLDVLSIAERFHHLLTRSYFDERTHQRWEAARRKPRTLAKLLLLTALERCLDADDQINALYYRLLDWIQPRIARSLALIEGNTEEDAQVELLTREDMEQLKGESALPVPLDYEQFRHHLLVAFCDYLLEGINLPETMRLISGDISRQRGVRPVLLVDDLVQSVNLFATDLLDYLITLDAGNWDVVIGLTPGALENSTRGRELLDRITYLDTIDDRVEKLWLSDMQGHDSYFLNEANCHEFAARYMTAYRARNGRNCVACPHYERCTGLDGDEQTLPLAPFNRAVLQRLYRGLPEGKGKARHLLKRLREILAAIGDGENPLNVLVRYVQPDIAVETSDDVLARIAELYSPPVVSEREMTLPSTLLAAFGLPARSVTLRAEPLLQKAREPMQAQLDQIKEVGPAWIADADKLAVKAWLDRDTQALNRQSLFPLRRGLSRWLRAIYPTDALHADGIARPHRVLCWTRTHLATQPPIHLDGVDEYAGIALSPDVGHAAFDLCCYARATGEEAQALSERLTQDERLLPTLFAAADYRRQTMKQLEVQLGLSAEELALALYVAMLTVEGLPDQRPPGFDDAFWNDIASLCASRRMITLDEEQRQAIHDLFDDFFKLRDNVYDGPGIAQLVGGRTPEVLLEWLMRVNAVHLDQDYRLDNAWLGKVVEIVEEAICHWRRTDECGCSLSLTSQGLVNALLTNGEQGVLLCEVPERTWIELQLKWPEEYAVLRVVFGAPDTHNAFRELANPDK